MTPPSDDPSSRTNRWILALLTTAAILFLAYLLRFVLIPFLVAGGLAYLSTPMLHWLMARLRMPRWVAALVPFFMLLGALTLLGLIVRSYVLPELTTLLTQREEILERFLSTVFQGKPIPAGGGKTFTAHDAARVFLDSAQASFPRSDLIQNISVAFSILMLSIMTIVLFLYFLVDGPRIVRGMLWVVPPPLRPRAEIVGRRCGPVIFNYVRGIIVIMLYAAIFCWIVMRFVIHLPHAIILALAVGVLELVPLVGPILSIVTICLVAVEQMTLWNIIGMAVFVTLLRVTIDQFVGPLVLGRVMRLPAPVIIFSFLVGGTIWGLMGVAVSIPAAAIIKLILEEAYEPEDSHRA